MLYKKGLLGVPFVCLLLLLLQPSVLYGQTFADVIEADNSVKQLENVLRISEQFNTDIERSKKILAPVLELSLVKKSIPLRWAYYMMLADAYSNKFDNTNVASDRCYALARKLLEKEPSHELEMVGYSRQGHYNYIHKKISDAFPYFLKARDLKSKVDIQKIPWVVRHHVYMASFFSHIGDQEVSVELLQEAVPFSKPASRERIDLINSIAVYLQELKLNDKAYDYYMQALRESEIAKDTVWIGIISGNLSKYALAEGNDEKALALVKKNRDYSLRYHEIRDIMRTYLSLARIYISKKEWKLAKENIQESKRFMDDKSYSLRYHMDAAHLLSQVYLGLGNKEEELKHLHEYLTLRDSLEKRTDIQELQKIIWQGEKDKYQQVLQKEDAKRSLERNVTLFVVITLTLIFFIVLLLIHRSQASVRMQNTLLEKKQSDIAYEKQLVDQELEILKSSLQEFTQTIKQNDRTINLLRTELNERIGQGAVDVEDIANNLDSLLKVHIMTEERWLKFKYVFDKVYPGYLGRMKEDFEKITENDLKIIALQKLDLSNSTMSDLLCISKEGIKKAKQRLKKKMEQEMH